VVGLDVDLDAALEVFLEVRRDPRIELEGVDLTGPG
jgi:hypothetical protein